MNLSQLITGVVIICFGIFLISLSFVSDFIMLIYGIPILTIGLFILFNKEDKIEKRKDTRR
ncbi:hypothetical protein DRN73_08325 [Candidatus Pacearchaeota archaeon]|nr:MAG: hypothetical protein DRN73_08325 [Candidatus Pacearchaeota archaeon]